ncbi:MAG TPA: tetratricopeptide repeat protein [Acidobacteriaceae bacterium]|nr:tetratricopeptide repeat protein [Acidobacteriaceae bacterium]
MGGNPVRRSLAILAVLVAAAPCTMQAQQPTVQSGNTLLDAGDAAQARTIFESILAADPAGAAAQQGEVAASERIALDQRAKGQMADALQTLMRAQRYAPQNARLAYDLGVLEDEMHLYPEATASLNKAEQLHFDNPSLLYAEARVFLDRQQLDPAEKKMLAYLQLRPGDATAYYGLGRIYQLGLHFEKSRQAFQKSIELEPEQTEAWYQLGDIALKENRDDEALADFSRTLARNPRHGGALAGAGEACFRQKQYEQALDYLNRAVAAAPDYAPGHYYLGLTLARLGRKDESQRELAAAAKLADAANRQAATQYQITTPNQPQ